MSLQPQPVAPVPDETARVARAAFPKGNSYLRLRDELGTVFRDERLRRPLPHPRPAGDCPPGGWPWSPSCSSPRTSPIARPPTPSAAASTGSTPSASS